jgi:hypothetical protein
VVNHLLLEFLDHRHPRIPFSTVAVKGVLPLLDILYRGVPGVRTSSVLALFSGPSDSSHIVEVRFGPDRIAIPA